MRKFLVLAVLLVPSAAPAGQVSSQLHVGITITGDSATRSARSARAPVRGFVRTTRGSPFRRHVVQDVNGTRIETTEF